MAGFGKDYGDDILLAPFDWRDGRVLEWIDKFWEFGYRDSMKNLQRLKVKKTGALMRSLKWRTWADSGGDRQVWQARYNYYAKFVELALGKGMPYKELPPGIPARAWQPIKMPDRPRKAKPSIPTEMRKQAAKFTNMLVNKFSFSGLAIIMYALNRNVGGNAEHLRRLQMQSDGPKVQRQAYWNSMKS